MTEKWTGSMFMDSNAQKIVEFKNIDKEFPGVKALDNVSMDIYKGEAVALLGANGAGKSTLMKILSGAYERDSGEVILDGKVLPKRYSTLEARNWGIAIIYQELSLMPELRVMENVYMSHEPRKFANIINFDKMYKDTQQQLKRLNAEYIDPAVQVKTLALAQQQMIEIAKAIALDCKVLVMDEPTTSLTHEESEKLFEIITNLKKEGITVIYISHRLDEIFEICDRAIVMRDGHVAGTATVKDSSPEEVISMMTGRSIADGTVINIQRHDCSKKPPVLELLHMSDGGFIKDVSLTVHEGEVLGIGGLIGSKRTELMRMVCGADSIHSGKIRVHGKDVHISNIRQAIKAGIGYLTENRKEEGLSLGLKVEENTIHCDMKSVSKNGILSWKKVRKVSDSYIDKLNTKGTSDTIAGNLSGGNQQKVVIAKWLHAECDVLIFDEPTRGIDVMAKAEIHQLIRKFAEGKGKAAIVISSEVNELVDCCDRIIIMSKGHITGELNRDEISESALLTNITTKGR